MAIQLLEKLNRQGYQQGQGEPLTSSFLVKCEISRQLIYSYCKHNWLKKRGSGVYSFPDEEITQTGVLRALQNQLNLNVHFGGKTAFSLFLGGIHFLAMGISSYKIYLFCGRNTVIPQWIHSLPCFQKDTLFIYKGNPITNWDIGFLEYENTRISSSERAILEQLSFVGKTETFDESFKLMEGLVHLRPDVLMDLLLHCHSIKTKRLFLYFAEKLDYSWFHQLDIAKIDLGSGPRQIVKQGVYNKKYKIVIPQDE